MRATTSDPDILVLQGGGGTRTFVGMLFILAGFAWMAVPSVFQMESLTLWFAIGFWIALAAILIGVIVAGGRWGRTFDRRQGQYTSWWGLLVPLRRKQQALQTYSAVRLERSITETGPSGGASGRSTYVCYPVTLVNTTTPHENLRVLRNRKYFRSRKTAEAIARFLVLPLHDTTSGQKVIREPNRLDESFADRTVRLGEDAKPPNSPAEGRLHCETVKERAEVVLPPLGLSVFQTAFVLVVSAVLIGASAYVGVSLDDLDDPETPARVIPVAVGILFLLFMFVPGVGRILYRARSRERIAVSRQGLWVRRRFLLFGSRCRISANELEEFENREAASKQGLLSPWRGRGWLRAQSDRVECEFGRSLAPVERQWLFETIRSVLINGPSWR